MGRDVAAGIRDVKQRIDGARKRSGRQSEVTLVAVTKEADVDQVRLAIECGVVDVGENRVQDALDKIEAVGEGVRWHFIGHLQRNKVRHVVGKFGLIHSVDSLRLARRLGDVAKDQGEVVPVLVQVNIAGEQSKFGISPDQAREFVATIGKIKGILVQGLMTMAPYHEQPERSRPVFRALSVLKDRLNEEFPELDLSQLSMGMTDDFEVAVEEGATIVRVGRAIFGEGR